MTPLADSHQELGKLAAVLANTGGLPEELAAPRFAELRATWAQSSDHKWLCNAIECRSPDREIATHAAAQRVDEAVEQFTRSWGVDAQDANTTASRRYNALNGCIHNLGLLLKNDGLSERSLSRVRELAPLMVTGICTPGGLSVLQNFSHDGYGWFLVGLGQAAPTEFARLVELLLPALIESAAKFRRRIESGSLSPATLGGVFAALALAPMLLPEWEKQLLKFAGKKNVTPMALFALYRQGHAESIDRLQSLESVHALRAVFDVDQSAPDALFFTCAQGRQWLHQNMLDPQSPLWWWSGSIVLARTLGAWDSATTESWFKALESGHAWAKLIVNELPPLNDEDHARILRCLTGSDAVAFERGFPRVNTVDQAIDYFSQLSKGAVFRRNAPRVARQMTAHFDAISARFPKDLLVHLTLELAQVPLTDSLIPLPTFAWAKWVRALEPVLLPSRADVPTTTAVVKAKRARKPPA